MNWIPLAVASAIFGAIACTEPNAGEFRVGLIALVTIAILLSFAAGVCLR